MNTKYFKLLIVGVVVILGVVIALIIFAFKNESKTPQITDVASLCSQYPEYCQDVSMIENYKPIKPILVAAFENSNKARECYIDPEAESWVSKNIKPECIGGIWAEKELTPDVKASLRMNKVNTAKNFEPDIVYNLEFYKKTGEKLTIPVISDPDQGRAGYLVSYVDDKNILVEVGQDEAPSYYYFYDGTKWNELASPDPSVTSLYYSGKPEPYNFSISPNLIMKASELIWTYTEFYNDIDKERAYKAGSYEFLVDLKTNKLVGAYVNHGEMQDSKYVSKVYNIDDAIVTFSELAKLFSNQ